MKKGKAGKIILAAVLALLVLLLIGIIGTAFKFREEIAIIRSIRKVDDKNGVYMMDFKDGYHLDDLLKANVSSDQELAAVLTEYVSHGFAHASESEEQHIGCSTLTCMSQEGHMLWGRNFDWETAVPIIVRATPKDGYASISLCHFGNITGDPSAVPEGMENAFKAVGAYLVPMDGINEKGLCIAELEVNEGGQKLVETGKPNITTTLAIRMLLDRAATVDEAIGLLNQYDIAPSGGISSHLSISDRSGKAVAVEFMDGKAEIVDTPVVTNFNLKNGDITAGGENPMLRYNVLMEALEETGGIMTTGELVSAMQKAVQPMGQWTTKWTVICDNGEKPGVTYYWNADYDHPLNVELPWN